MEEVCENCGHLQTMHLCGSGRCFLRENGCPCAEFVSPVVVEAMLGNTSQEQE